MRICFLFWLGGEGRMIGWLVFILFFGGERWEDVLEFGLGLVNGLFFFFGNSCTG